MTGRIVRTWLTIMVVVMACTWSGGAGAAETIAVPPLTLDAMREPQRDLARHARWPVRLALLPEVSAAELLGIAPQASHGPDTLVKLDLEPQPALAAASDRLATADPLLLQSADDLALPADRQQSLTVMGVFEVQGYYWEYREDDFGRAYYWDWPASPRVRPMDRIGRPLPMDGYLESQADFLSEPLDRHIGTGIYSEFGQDRRIGVQFMFIMPSDRR